MRSLHRIRYARQWLRRFLGAREQWRQSIEATEQSSYWGALGMDTALGWVIGDQEPSRIVDAVVASIQEIETVEETDTHEEHNSE